jgi:hypothetical protein
MALLQKKLVRDASRAYFNCLSGGTNVPPLLGFVPPLICVPPLSHHSFCEVLILIVILKYLFGS